MLEYLIKKPLYPRSKQQSVIKVKSYSALLRMLLVRIRNYLKSFPRYRFLILGTTHPATLYYVSKDVRFLGYFSKPRQVREQRSLGNNNRSYSFNPYPLYVTQYGLSQVCPTFYMLSATSATFGPHAGNMEFYRHIYVYVLSIPIQQLIKWT